MTNQDARPSSVNDLTVFSFLALKEVCPWLVPVSLMFATNARENMLKAMRLTAVPASMGLLSFQVYASNEKETPKQEFQKVDELSMYTSPLSDSTYVEDKPTQLEESISWLRHSIAPYTSKCQVSGVQASESVQTPQGEQRFPVFPAPGADPSVFLNAMFSIFSRAMAPAGAPAGPMGLLVFTLGLPVPYKQAPFVPFYPGEGAGSARMTLPPWMMLPIESMAAPDRSRSTHRALHPLLSWSIHLL
ncbi:hypothetical protein NDU88_005235 [Pleurodeles waltl]|uniref:Uncharacterized protein n=1 Tax=Pleurodeles waltl TaxID=8319 RepID=A0AAV7NQV5_PLEWA|nr:hypothetical protein NDU88_005235 [Pleurodeles waltl]